MDWFYFAKKDYEIYQDTVRLQNFVDLGKITQAQYDEIVSAE
jgi:hypothetical protein